MLLGRLCSSFGPFGNEAKGAQLFDIVGNILYYEKIDTILKMCPLNIRLQPAAD